MRTGRLFVLVMLMAMFSPGVVLATEPPAVTDYGMVLSDFLGTVVFPVAGSILLGLAGLVINKIKKKYNLSISQQQEEIVDDLMKKGIAYAEERAAAALKSGVTKFSGNQKADEAIAFVMAQAPHLPMATIEAKIISWLGLTTGVGATGNHAVGNYVFDPVVGK